MGDSVAAGEGAMPVTHGYAYQLYDHGVFGQKQAMDFSNLSVRGGRSWDLRDHQVAQLLCATPRPSVVTITAGANDFLRGDFNVPAIASRVVEAVNILLNNGTPFVPPALTVLTRVPASRALGGRTGRSWSPTITPSRTRFPLSRRSSTWRFAASIWCCRRCSLSYPFRTARE